MVRLQIHGKDLQDGTIVSLPGRNDKTYTLSKTGLTVTTYPDQTVTIHPGLVILKGENTFEILSDSAVLTVTCSGISTAAQFLRDVEYANNKNWRTDK